MGIGYFNVHQMQEIMQQMIPFIKTNDTKKVRIIVCFGVLKKPRVAIKHP